MILIINSAEPGIREFTEPLKTICDQQNMPSRGIEYVQVPEINLKNYQGIIISGSPTGDDIVDHHKPYYAPLLTFTKPILGICAGHHILGSFYQAELIRMKQKEIGTIRISILMDDPIFKTISNPFEAYTMHHDSISLPHSFLQLATSEICTNQLMKHQSLPWYTLQFHPEIKNHKIIENFINICHNHIND